jgi:hypothetical protein
MWYNKDENRYGDRKIEFIGVSITDNHGDEKKEFEVGEFLNISILIKSGCNFGHVDFSFGYRTVKGLDVYVYNGSRQYQDCSIQDIHEGALYQIQIKQKVLLVPGEYSLSFALISDPGDEPVFHDMRYNVCMLRVVSDGRQYAGVFQDDSVLVRLTGGGGE